MQKVHFLVFHQDSQAFINDLMNLGMVQLVRTESSDKSNFEQLELSLKDAEKALKQLERQKKKKGQVAESTLSVPPSVDSILQLEKRLEQCQQLKDKLYAEIQLMEPWGQFQWKTLQSLEEKSGVRVRFFQYPVKTFKQQWMDIAPLAVINEQKGQVYFMLFQEDENLEFPTVPISLPDRSLEELNKELDSCLKEEANLLAELHFLANVHMEKISHTVDSRMDDLHFKESLESAENLCNEQVHYWSGWLPENKVNDFKSYMDSRKIVYFLETVPKEEKAPVLLKNNAFSRLFEPIGNLFSLPAYAEMDLTAFFAPFFFLFFGFCLGDAGYGIVMLIAASIAHWRIKEDYKAYARLGQLFGVSTAIVGFFSGTLFGLEMIKEPFFQPLHHLFFTQDQLFNVALGIGLAQIIFALAINAYKQYIFRGWKFSIAKIGWIMLLLSLVDVYVLELVTPFSVWTLWVGLAMIVVMGAPEKSAIGSIGYGLADLYNITGVAGDLLSYIRLFALGVSSAILGLVVNNIALESKGIPYLGPVIFILVLVVGHTANLALASLSAFVHPMRLTFVEFYKNAGFQGGGKPFKPLVRKTNIQEVSKK